MEFSTRTARAETVKTDAVVVGVHADGELTPSAKAVDTASGGAIRAAIKSGEVTGKRGGQVVLRNLAGVTAPRVLVEASAAVMTSMIVRSPTPPAPQGAPSAAASAKSR